MPKRLPWAPGLLLLGYGVLLALTLTRHVTEDSIKYVKDSLAGGAALFHPHHLLYHGLMSVVVRASGLGFPDVDRSLRAMQLANIVISLAALVVFHRTCRQIGTSTRVATLLSLLLALASAFFQFASQVEVYNGLALFSCLGVLGMAMPSERRGRRWLVGVGYFCAMGFHQVGIFLGVAIFVDEWLRQRGTQRWLGLARSLGLPLAAMALAYGLVGAGLGHRTPGALWEWITLYGHLPYWGLGRADPETLRNLAVGVGKALVDTTRLPNWILGLAAAGLAAFGAVHVRALPRSGPRARLLLALLVWLIVYGVFMTWWDAANVESWIVASVPLLLVLGCLTTGAEAAALPVRARQGAWAGLLVCLILMVVADVTYLRHDRRPNLAREAALRLRTTAAAGDLVIALDTDKGAYYDLYLCGQGVRVEPINFGIAMQAATRLGSGSFTAAVIEELVTQVGAVQVRGSKCFLDAWVQRGDIATIRNMQDIDLPEFRARLAATFDLQPVGADTEPLIFLVVGVREPRTPR